MVVVVGVGTQRERRFAEINESLSRFENIPTPSVHPTEHHPMLSPNYHNLYLLKRPNRPTVLARHSCAQAIQAGSLSQSPIPPICAFFLIVFLRAPLCLCGSNFFRL